MIGLRQGRHLAACKGTGRMAVIGRNCGEMVLRPLCSGHQTSKEVTRYTKGASQRTRAESALNKMIGEHSVDNGVPLFATESGGGTISTSK